MTDSGGRRPYKYIDVKKLEEDDGPPITDPLHVVLEDSLLDIIQLASDNGLSDDAIDDVLQKIVDERAFANRQLFVVHDGKRKNSKVTPRRRDRDG